MHAGAIRDRPGLLQPGPEPDPVKPVVEPRLTITVPASVSELAPCSILACRPSNLAHPVDSDSERTPPKLPSTQLGRALL